MPGRYIHRQKRRIFVTVWAADGTVRGRHRADGLVGSPTMWERFITGLRSKLGEGDWLDTAEADAEHQRLIDERERALRVMWPGSDH
jgi:hypothetical protein